MRILIIILLLILFPTEKLLSLEMTNLKRIAGVYSIENTITKEFYIGGSIDCKRRQSEHLIPLRKGVHYNKNLQWSWNIYTEKYFKFKLLVTCPPEYVQNLEDWFIKKLKPTYNFNLDARGGVNNFEHKQKLRNLRLRDWKDPNYRKNILAGSIKAVERLHLKSGKVLGEYVSIMEASRKTGIHSESIGNTCRGQTFTGGRFRWRFKGEQEKGTSTWKKRVEAKNIKTLEVVGVYNSIKEASEKTECSRSAISGCLSGYRKTSKGLIWTYKQS